MTSVSDEPQTLEHLERLLETNRLEGRTALALLASSAHSPSIRAQALAGVAIDAAGAGSTAGFEESARLLAEARDLTSLNVQALARIAHASGYLHFRQNANRESLIQLNEAAQLYPVEDRRRAHVFDTMGMYFAGRGDFVRACDYYRLSHALKVERGLDSERAGVAITCGNLARVALATGRFDDAEAWFKADLNHLEHLNAAPHLIGAIRTQLASALMQQGAHRIDEARGLIQAGLTLTEPGSLARAFAHKEATQLALMDTDLDDARRQLAVCKSIRAEHDYPHLDPWIDWLEALLISHGAFSEDKSKYAEALVLLQRAIEAFEGKNMVREQCEAYLATVELMVRAGDKDAAHSVLVNTLIPIAERTLFEQQNPLNAIENALGHLNQASLNQLYLQRQLGGVSTEALTGRLRSQKKTLVIWSCDLRGFSAFCRDADNPMVIVRMLNRFLAAVGQRILDAGGTIDKYVGDNILAYFEDADSAVNVALATLDAMKALNVERVHLAEEPLEVSVGIATGEVVQGNIGFAGKLEYTVIGPAVNKAFRLVSAADPATVLLDDPTVAAMNVPKAVTIVDGVTLKGVGPVKVYQLTETLLP